MTESRWVRTNHSVYNVGYHLIWCPKCRAKVIKGRFETSLKEILTEKANKMGIVINNMETMPDHIHLFIKADPNLSIQYIVKMLKDYSSWKLRSKFPWLGKYRALWSPSYYCETIGDISE